MAGKKRKDVRNQDITGLKYFGKRLPRTPAMAADLTDHVWPLWEWLTFPVRQRE